MFSLVFRTTFVAIKRAALAIGMLSLFFLSSCSAGSQSAETRRDFAVRFNQGQLVTSKNEVHIKWSKDILAALGITDPKNIGSPKIASAILSKGRNGTYGLFAFWIEDQPSVDGVEFRFSDQSVPAIASIPEPELKQIRATAKDTIVFGFEYDWKATSELPKGLDQIASANVLKIRLLRAKAPATDWFPVDFYKVDRWVSGSVTNH